MVPSAKLPGAVQRDLEEALRSAFSTPGALRRMVQHGLGENLYSIAATENLTIAVFELVNWAQEHGQLEELIGAALEKNRSNAALSAFAEKHGIGGRSAGGSGARSQAGGRSPYDAQAATPTRPSLRRLLAAVLRSDTDLAAFCLDYFPGTHARFTNCMERVAKTTLLLEHEDLIVILARLREHDEAAVARDETLLRYE